MPKDKKEKEKFKEQLKHVLNPGKRPPELKSDMITDLPGPKMASLKPLGKAQTEIARDSLFSAQEGKNVLEAKHEKQVYDNIAKDLRHENEAFNPNKFSQKYKEDREKSFLKRNVLSQDKDRNRQINTIQEALSHFQKDPKTHFSTLLNALNKTIQEIEKKEGSYWKKSDLKKLCTQLRDKMLNKIPELTNKLHKPPYGVVQQQPAPKTPGKGKKI